MQRDEVRTGFTLLELLVVIGILSLLAALIFPAWNAGLERARSARCASNLRQLYAATMNYVMARGGYYPDAVSHEVQNTDGSWRYFTGWVHWQLPAYNYVAGPVYPEKTTFWFGSNGLACITNGHLFPYVGNPTVYLCPTFARRGVCNVSDPKRSYVMNSRMSGVNLYACQNASRILLFADGGLACDVPRSGGVSVSRHAFVTAAGNPSYANAYGLGNGYYGAASDGALQGSASGMHVVEHIGEYHNKQGNVVFADGHVLQLSYTATVTLCSGTY